MTGSVPRSLRAVVRARRGGWRLRIAPLGGLGMLGPVVRILVRVIAFVLGSVGFLLMEMVGGAAIFGVIGLFVAVDMVPLGFVAFFLMLPLPFVAGWKMLASARAMAAAVKHVAVGFHWVDIQPAATPARFVAGGRVHRSVIEVADLTSVIVRHGEPALELVLRTGNTTLVLPATMAGPLRRVDSRALADWLAEVLTPSEVPVFHCRAAYGDDTLPADVVAKFWQVPVEDVPALADRCGVHTCDGRDTPMYNRYDVEASVERAQAIEEDDQAVR